MAVDPVTGDLRHRGRRGVASSRPSGRNRSTTTSRSGCSASGCAGARAASSRSLLDQSFVAGVGNIYADEALWRARLHPLRTRDDARGRPTSDTSTRAPRDPAEAVERRGSSIDDYTAPDGDGSMQERLDVYQRTGEPCPRCGRPIRRIVIGARSTHFCSWCQRLPAADRAGAVAILRACAARRCAPAAAGPSSRPGRERRADAGRSGPGRGERLRTDRTQACRREPPGRGAGVRWRPGTDREHPAPRRRHPRDRHVRHPRRDRRRDRGRRAGRARRAQRRRQDDAPADRRRRGRARSAARSSASAALSIGPAGAGGPLRRGLRSAAGPPDRRPAGARRTSR